MRLVASRARLRYITGTVRSSSMLNAVVATDTFLHRPDVLRRIFHAHYDVRLWVSVLNLMHAVAQVEDEGSFQTARANMQLVSDVVGANIFPVPETHMRRLLGLDPRTRGTNLWDWLTHVILSEHSYEDAVEGREVPAAGQRINVKLVRGWRDRYLAMLEGHFIDVIHAVKPGVSLANVRLTPPEVAAVKQLFASPVSDKLIMDPYLERVDLLVDASGAEKQARALQVFSLFNRGFKGLLLRCFETGYRPRSVDFINLSLLLPIHEPDWVLVTEDESLLDMLKRGAMPINKYCAAESLLY